MINVSKDQVRQLAPRAKPIYLDAFDRAPEVLPRYGITSGLRISHFIAQLAHETGGFAILVESLNYRAEGLMKTWPKRFPTIEKAREYEHRPEKIANAVYADRMGNTAPGDGWKYIGRGFVQLTGKSNYSIFGRMLNIDLVGNPDLALDPKHSLEIAAAFFAGRGCNEAADRNDLRAVTLAINGGLIGLAERHHWLLKTQSIW